MSITPRLPSNTTALDASGIDLGGASIRVRSVSSTNASPQSASASPSSATTGTRPSSASSASSDASSASNNGDRSEGYAEVTLLNGTNRQSNGTADLWMSFHPLGAPHEIQRTRLVVGKVVYLALGQQANITLGAGHRN
jgi:hypothetical protein